MRANAQKLINELSRLKPGNRFSFVCTKSSDLQPTRAAFYQAAKKLGWNSFTRAVGNARDVPLFRVQTESDGMTVTLALVR